MKNEMELITKTDLAKLDPVTLTKLLLAFNEVVRKEIICTDGITQTPVEKKWETVLSEQSQKD